VKKNTKSIAIIGLGLIGGSLAKALKGRGYTVIGITKNPKTIKFALKEKAIKKGFTKLNSKVLENVDIIFICTPLPLIKDYLNKISKFQPEAGPPLVEKRKKKIIVTDVGSTKFEICKYASSQFSTLNSQFFFIGGHPMAGTAKAGFIASKKDLFKNCSWALTPSKRDFQALTELKKIIKKVGAKLIITTPKKHDQAVALISHLPLLASIGLCELVKDSKLKELASKLASSGFRDTTRIAGGNSEMNGNLLISNLTVLKKLLPSYIKELNKFLKMAGSKPENLYKKLNIASKWRNNLYNLKDKNIV